MIGKKGQEKGNTEPEDYLLKGTLVDVIGGVYPGRRAIILGHTAKMYNVKLDDGRVTLIRRTNVRPVSSRESPVRLPQDKGTCRQQIEVEMVKIHESLNTIVALLDRMNLEKSENSSQDNDRLP
jgi:hypothetical protein